MKNKKNNKGLLSSISFRTKAEVILIAALLISIYVSSVWGTVTITNTSMSTDDSDLVINFEDGWIKADNVTIDNVSVNILQLIGRTTDPPSLADGMIWYNTTVDLFYCRAGGATYTFNLTAV